jgi:hypothetical protein
MGRPETPSREAQDRDRAAATAARTGRPFWQECCRAELLRIDPRYLVAFDVRWDKFNGDCTAAQLARHLKQRGFDWAPSRRTIERWLQVIIPIETRHQQANKSR